MEISRIKKRGEASRAEPASVAACHDASHETVPNSSKMHILVVEDEQDYRSLVQSFCTRMGHTCTGAAGCDEAMEKIGNEQFDLVISDIIMHGKNGLEMMMEVKKTHPELDFIIMTGFGAQYSYGNIISCGASDYIAKPFEMSELHAKLDRLQRERSLFRQVREANNYLENLFESSPDAIGIVDKQGKFLKWNRMASELYGYTLAELKGVPYSDLYADKDQLEKMLLKLRAEGAIHKHEVRMKRKDGSVAAFEISIALLRDTKGVVLGSVCMARDKSALKKLVEELRQEVTRRLEIEEALRESEAVFRESELKYRNLSQEFHALLDAIPDGLALLAPDLTIVWANRSLAALQGKKDGASLIGNNCHSQLHSKDEPCPGCPVVRTFGTGEQATFQTCAPDGRIFEVRSVPVQDERGNVIKVISVTRDISEDRAAQEELRRTNTELSQLIGSIPSFLIELTSDYRITRWNCSAEKTFGITAARVLGKPLEECGIEWNWKEVLDAISMKSRDAAGGRLDDLSFWRPDGKRGFLELTINSVDTSDGTSGILLLGSDITSRKILESQLVQAQKLESIGQLAAGIAHEINTPAQYVGDNMRFLMEAFEDLDKFQVSLDRLLDPAQSAKPDENSLQQIQDAASEADLQYLRQEIPKAIGQSLEGIERINRIVRAMKEFSHPGTETKTNVDLNKAIDSTITVARNEWKYVADVVTDLDASLPLVPCLPGEFNQVVLNMIINAAHAIAAKQAGNTQEKGTITVSTRVCGQSAEISISDTGTGIRKEISSKIFDPFFTTKEVGKGTGQGLAIARSVIVDKHNGTIDFESEVDKGTTFCIKLPLISSSKQ